MFESHVETCIDWKSFAFQFKDFRRNLYLKINFYCITDHPFINQSQRSELIDNPASKRSVQGCNMQLVVYSFFQLIDSVVIFLFIFMG